MEEKHKVKYSNLSLTAQNCRSNSRNCCDASHTGRTPPAIGDSAINKRNEKRQMN